MKSEKEIIHVRFLLSKIFLALRSHKDTIGSRLTALIFWSRLVIVSEYDEDSLYAIRI